MLENFERLSKGFAFSTLGACALVACLRTPAGASEVDNYTDRALLTRDAQPVLDAKINKILEHAVVEANKSSPFHCNKVLLRQEIVRWTGPDPVSILELWATLSDDVQRTPTGFSDSVYAGTSFTDSPAMKIFGIGRTFLLAGHVVGTDKLGHFFMQGLDYFKRVEVDGVPLDYVLANEHGEDGIWGLKATGVKSYGDMAANFSGYQFWRELYQGTNPYVRCENGKTWSLVRKFAWSDYVNDSWDEAINCSEMVPGIERTVKHNLDKLHLRCPVDPTKCLAISHLEKASFYVSPACLSLFETQPGRALASAPSPSPVADPSPQPSASPLASPAPSSSPGPDYKLSEFVPFAKTGHYTSKILKFLDNWPPPTLIADTDREIFARLIRTPGHPKIIGLVKHSMIQASVEKVVETIERYEDYPKMWEDLVSVKVESRDRNRTVTEWTRKAPTFFMPRLHYRMLYTADRSRQDRVVFRQQLIDGNALNASDVIVVVERRGDNLTRLSVINFFDPDAGPFRSLVEGVIWDRSYKSAFKDDVSFRAHVEHPDWDLDRLTDEADHAWDKLPSKDARYTDQIKIDDPTPEPSQVPNAAAPSTPSIPSKDPKVPTKPKT